MRKIMIKGVKDNDTGTEKFKCLEQRWKHVPRTSWEHLTTSVCGCSIVISNPEMEYIIRYSLQRKTDIQKYLKAKGLDHK